MRIVIESVSIGGNKQCLVGFSSRHGQASAVWVGEAPSLGNEYDVEIDVEGPLVWGREAGPGSAESFIKLEGGRPLLAGRSKYIGNGSALGLQLDNDVILLEIVDLPPNIPEYIEVRPLSLKLYDVNL